MGSLPQRVWLLTPGGYRTLCGDWPPDASQPCFQSFGVRGRGPVSVSVRQASRHVLEMQRPGVVVRGAAAGLPRALRGVPAALAGGTARVAGGVGSGSRAARISFPRVWAWGVKERRAKLKTGHPHS